MNLTTRPGLPLRAVEWSASVYTALLVLYPAAYRCAYGPQMIQLFRDLSRDAARSTGTAGLLRWWLMAGFDLLTSAFAERRRTPLRLTRSIVRRVLMLCLIAGGVCFSIAGYSQLQPYSHYNLRGIYQVAFGFIYPGFVLLALGSAGLAWSVWRRASPLARLMATAACAGMAVVSAAMTAGVLLPGDESWTWYLGMLGLILHYAGLGMLGLISLRARLLPRWNAVPVLMCLVFFIMWVSNRGSDTYGPQWGMFLVFAGLGIGYVLIGLSLRRALVRPTAVPA